MHGSYGSPDENWFRYLERELKSLGHTVILDQYPVDTWESVDSLGPEKGHDFATIQSLDSWQKFFKEVTLPKLGSDPFIFVGHSSAPIFMLHLLQTHTLNLHGAIFVAPFFNIPDAPAVWQFWPVNKTFYGYDFDFAKIKSQIGKSYVVYGDDDPYVPASEPPLFAEKLGSEIVVVPGGGHCGGKFKEFPLILDLCQKLLS